MKKNPLLFFLLSLSLYTNAQVSKYDTVAIFILDHMSAVIGDLSSCSYTLQTTTDDLSDDGSGLVTHFGTHDVMLTGPDKMQVNSTGDKGHRGYWYNGKQLAFYSYDENNYSVLNAPATIVETMDALNKNYGIDFPAADFFYPTFTDDLINQNHVISYLGKSRVGDKECYHILAKGKEMSVQLWIANDVTTLPVKMLIMYSGEANAPQYEATFSNWKINLEIPSSVYEFMPPPEANRIAMMPK